MRTLETLFPDDARGAFTEAWLGRAGAHHVLVHGLRERLPALWSRDTIDVPRLLVAHLDAGGKVSARGRDGIGQVVESHELGVTQSSELLAFGASLRLHDPHLGLPAIRSLAVGLLSELALPSARILPVIDVYPAGLREASGTEQRACFLVVIGGELRLDLGESVIARPGDVLFIPGGTPFSMEPSDLPTWTLSLLLRRQSALDFATAALEETAERHEHCRRPFEGVSREQPGVLDSVLASLREATEALEAKALRERYHIERIVRPYERVPGFALRMDEPGRITVLAPNGAEVTLDAPAETMPLFGLLAGALRRVRYVDVCDQLPSVDPNLIAAALGKLVDAGYLEPPWLEAAPPSAPRDQGAPVVTGFLERLFEDAADTFLAECWPNVHKHLFAEGLDKRIPALFDPALTGTVDALLAAHRGPRSAQGVDAQGRVHVASVGSVEEAKALLAHGVCVQLHAVHRCFPALDAFVRELQAALGLPEEVDPAVTVFITPPGARLGKHFDDKDVWVVGLTGTKHFWVAPNTAHTFPTRIQRDEGAGGPATVDRAPHMLPDAACCAVGLGSCLFIPRGYWHDTVPAETLCWSLSVGLRRPTLAKVCVGRLRGVLSSRPEMVAGLPGFSKEFRPRTDQALAAVVTAAREELGAMTGRLVLDHLRSG